MTANLSEVGSIPKATRKKGKRKINPQAVPTWAQELIAQVAADYDVPVPPVRWRISRAERRYMLPTGEIEVRRTMQSSGSTYWSKKEGKHTHIAITVGIDFTDQRLVLLHELAHWSLHYTQGHSRTFWRRAWEMYDRYGVDLDYAWEREKTYKKAAMTEAPMSVKLRHTGGI